jgi:hypothetical protein
MHLREPEAGKYSGVGPGRYTSLDERPDFWFDNRGEDSPTGNTCIAYCNWGSGVPVPDIAHQPSLVFIPYLVTGDRFYNDEMMFWANFCLTASYAHDGALALVKSNEQRGMAWAMRNLADAAAFAPDNDPVKYYMGEKLLNNLNWFDQYALTHQTPLGHFFEENNVPGNESYKCVSYGGGYGQLAWAIDRAIKYGFNAGQEMREGLSKFVLKLFNSEPAFARESAMPLWLRVGPADGSFYSTMSGLYSANRGSTELYAHWVRLALVIGVEQEFSGAQGAYDFNWPIATNPSNGVNMINTSGWAVLPTDLPLPPPVGSRFTMQSASPSIRLEAFPNPFSTGVNIHISSKEERGKVKRKNIEVGIYDISGKLIPFYPSLLLFPYATQVRWHAPNLPNGTYLLRVKNNDKTLTRKITKIK